VKLPPPAILKPNISEETYYWWLKVVKCSTHPDERGHPHWRTGKASKSIKARVTGTLTSDTLNVESIKVD
jgi:hypothetical protein